jgi:phosphatidylserine/phosphatidylglycerophosphate/cardiolipin synthase-like enzyme
MPSVSAHFSPKGGCQEAIVRELKKARREVLVQAHSFTAEPLTYALVEAKKRGVHVDVLLDRSNEQERSADLRVFLEQGLAPLIDPGHAVAHNKVMIIDQQTVITGSYNFTRQAEEENAENLLIIRGNAEVARLYRQNFLAHKAHSKPAQVKLAEAPTAARKAA